MSTLVLDSIQGKTSSTSTDVNDLKYQLATAWVNFDGTGTITIRDAYNVASITDLGAGDYQINFTVSMDNTNYSAIGIGGSRTDSGASSTPGINNPLVSSCILQTANSIGTAFVDFNNVNLTIHGGRA